MVMFQVQAESETASKSGKVADMVDLYNIPSYLNSRSISFENRTGSPHAGGKAASPLGVGRKGDPARMIEPGHTVELADIAGPGTIRHMWMTTYDIADTMRGLVIRAYWEDQEHPSIEAPLGDFFGFAHGKTPPFETAVHSVGEKYGLNIWIPMPFLNHARVTITNELDIKVLFFYQINYTTGDTHEDSFGRLHVLFRRENPTTKASDFELLPQRTGQGRYIGTVIGVRPTDPAWWGEGEVKFYLDGDSEFPTIVGTGTEDYVGQSWGVQQFPFQYQGANLVAGDRINTGPVSIYRWHLVDPVYWHKDIRVTIQQIGLKGTAHSLEEYKARLFERADDWCACTFWYEPVPSSPLSPIPDLAARLKDLELVKDKSALPLQQGNSTNTGM